MKNFLTMFSTHAAMCCLLAGCGSDTPESSSSAGASAEVDACTLLTAAEITAVTGITPDEAERANPGLNNCQWPAPGAFVPVVYIGLSYGTAKSWDDYRQYMIENDYGDPEEGGEHIDIGRFGHYMPDSAMIQVQTEQNLLITLRVRGGDKAQIIDLANKAATRLR